MSKVGDYIKKWRKGKGIRQADLAQAIFVSKKTVGQWENGLNAPCYETLQLLKNVMGCEWDDIM